MKRIELMKELNRLDNKEEVNFTMYESKNTIEIIVNDFLGFDNEWNEVDNTELDVEVIEQLFSILSTKCNSKDENKNEFYFEDVKVTFNYSSEEI